MLRLAVILIHVFLFELLFDRHLVLYIVREHSKRSEKEFSRSENIYVVPAVYAGCQDYVRLTKDCFPNRSIAFRLDLLSF